MKKGFSIPSAVVGLISIAVMILLSIVVKPVSIWVIVLLSIGMANLQVSILLAYICSFLFGKSIEVEQVDFRDYRITVVDGILLIVCYNTAYTIKLF